MKIEMEVWYLKWAWVNFEETEKLPNGWITFPIQTEMNSKFATPVQLQHTFGPSRFHQFFYFYEAIEIRNPSYLDSSLSITGFIFQSEKSDCKK